MTERLHLVFHDMQGFVDQMTKLGMVLGAAPMHLLHGKLDRRQWVLDFVRESASHLLPCTDTLKVFDARTARFDLGHHAIQGPSQVANLVLSPFSDANR